MILPSPRAVYRGLRKMLRFLARPARRAGSPLSAFSDDTDGATVPGTKCS